MWFTITNKKPFHLENTVFYFRGISFHWAFIFCTVENGLIQNFSVALFHQCVVIIWFPMNLNTVWPRRKDPVRSNLLLPSGKPWNDEIKICLSSRILVVLPVPVISTSISRNPLLFSCLDFNYNPVCLVWLESAVSNFRHIPSKILLAAVSP